MSCRRPSNKSSRLALPLGPSNSYFFSTASHGIRRRSAASASRARGRAFSFTRSCSRSVSHSFGDTIGGVLIGSCPPFRLFSGDVLIEYLLRVVTEDVARRGPYRSLRRRNKRG